MMWPFKRHEKVRTEPIYEESIDPSTPDVKGGSHGVHCICSEHGEVSIGRRLNELLGLKYLDDGEVAVAQPGMPFVPPIPVKLHPDNHNESSR